MKKLIAIIMATAMLGSISVYAEAIDFSGKSVDELLVIRDQVEEAIYAQGGQVILPFGEYLVGRDIAVGNYIIETHNSDGNTPWRIEVYKSAEDKEKYDLALKEYDAAVDSQEVSESTYMTFYDEVYTVEKISVRLEEGQLMVVERMWGNSVELTIAKSSGLFME